MHPRLSVHRTQKRDRHYRLFHESSQPFERLAISKGGSGVKLLVVTAPARCPVKLYQGLWWVFLIPPPPPSVKGRLEVVPHEK